MFKGNFISLCGRQVGARAALPRGETGGGKGRAPSGGGAGRGTVRGPPGGGRGEGRAPSGGDRGQKLRFLREGLGKDVKKFVYDLEYFRLIDHFIYTG